MKYEKIRVDSPQQTFSAIHSTFCGDEYIEYDEMIQTNVTGIKAIKQSTGTKCLDWELIVHNGDFRWFLNVCIL